MSNAFLQWLSSETPSAFWHDSAVPAEADEAVSYGAVGMTTNPFLVNAALKAAPLDWKPYLDGIPASLRGAERAEEITRRVTIRLAEKMQPIYEATAGKQGFVCAQVNPNHPCDAEAMVAQARRIASWAPNICVKLPCTALGLTALEQCVAEGLNVAATVSFTVPQVLETGEAFKRGAALARSAGKKPGLGIAVLMVGRLDDYLRDVARDNRSTVKESDIVQAGIAAIKRAYEIFMERGYEAILMPAGCRGPYHISELSGAKMIMSIGPKIAKALAECRPPFREQISRKISADVMDRLLTLKEFVKAYEPDGMKAGEFITFGSVNRTLTQFVESGWNQLENYHV